MFIIPCTIVNTHNIFDAEPSLDKKWTIISVNKHLSLQPATHLFRTFLIPQFQGKTQISCNVLTCCDEPIPVVRLGTQKVYGTKKMQKRAVTSKIFIALNRPRLQCLYVFHRACRNNVKSLFDCSRVSEIERLYAAACIHAMGRAYTPHRLTTSRGTE